MENRPKINVGDYIKTTYPNSPDLKVDRVLYDEHGKQVYVCSWFHASGILETKLFDKDSVAWVRHTDGSTSMAGMLFESAHN
jgi:hypothetical protein